MKKRLTVFIIAFVLLFQSTVPAYAADLFSNGKEKQTYQDYIIKYKDGYDNTSTNKELKDKKIKSLKEVKTLKDDKYAVVSLPDADTTKEYIERVTETDAIEFLVPDLAVGIFGDTDQSNYDTGKIMDDYYAYSENFQYNQDGPVIIAVADTGIDFKVCSGIYVNEREGAVNEKDDDGNSYKDDTNGWNFVDSNRNTNAAELHGTVITNIINRCIPQAKILPLKVVKNGTARTSDIINAIEYADSLGADIMNCSWGGAEYNFALKDAMESSDMLFVCAVDNDSLKQAYPASFGLENVISVGKAGAAGNADVTFAADGIEATGLNHVTNIYSGTSYATAFITSAMGMAYNSTEDGISASVYAASLKNSIGSSEDSSKLFDIEKSFDSITGYVKENKSSVGLIDITNRLQESLTDELRYMLLNGYEKLDSQEMNTISEVFHVDENSVEQLHQKGIDLITAVSVLLYGQDIGISGEIAGKLMSESEDYQSFKQTISQLENLTQVLELSSKKLEQISSYLNRDRSVMDIAGAIIASSELGLELEKIIDLGGRKSLTDIDFTKSPVTVENKSPYIRLLLEFNLSQEGLDSYISSEHADINLWLEKILQWQKEHKFYLSDTEVETFGAGNTENLSTFNKYQMPSVKSNLDDVSVSDLYGMASYERELFSLTGKNGLDLNLSLRYDEDDALGNSAYGDVDKLSARYCAIYKVDCYRSSDIYFNNPIYTDGKKWGELYTDESLHNDMLQVTSFEDGFFTYIVKDAGIIAMDSEYNHVEGQRSKSFNQELYTLGSGWSFNFPALEDNRSTVDGKEYGKTVLHFGDGQAYTVQKQSADSYKLCGYNYSDIQFKKVDSNTFRSGNRSSYWMITYKNQRRDFLDSTGRYIGTLGPDIGSNTERIEVRYNSDEYISEIIDTVGRRITMTYETVGIYDELVGETFYHREINFDFYDKGETTGEKYYNIIQFYDREMKEYVTCWLHKYDNQGEIIQSLRYTYDIYNTSLFYNYNKYYFSGSDSYSQRFDSYSSALTGIYYSDYSTEVETSATTIIEYEDTNIRKNISNASIVSYPRVKAVYNTSSGIVKNRKEYAYEVIDNNNNKSYSQFSMNGWNEIINCNKNINSDAYASYVLFFPRVYGFTYAVTVKETQDDNGSFGKATTNYYNDDRKLQKVSTYTLDSAGNKKLYSQTVVDFDTLKTRKETTRRYGDGIEICLEKITGYDEYANIVTSHVYTGTSKNGCAVENLKRKETYYREFGENKSLPIREKSILCLDTSSGQAQWAITDNTLSPSGTDIVRQVTSADDKIIKDTAYTYDSSYFNLLKSIETDKGNYGEKKQTEYSYDSKYGIYKSNVIKSSLTSAGRVIESNQTYKYDKFGRTVSVDNSGQETTYSYDALDLATCTYLPNNVRTCYHADYKNNTVEYTAAAFTHANYTEEGTHIKYVYDKFGKLTEEYIIGEYEAPHLTQKYEYDKNNRLITQYQYKSEGGKDYIKISKSYDVLDRITSIKTYDKNNTLLAREDYNYEIVLYNQIPCEKQTITTYNGNAQPSRNIEYIDSSGNVIAQQTEYAQNQFYTNTYTYGKYGHLIAQQGDTIDKKQFLYDSFGNLVKETDANNKSKTYSYDGYNRVRFVTNEKGENTYYDYDSMDRKTQVRKYAGMYKVNQNGQQRDEAEYAVTQYVYDKYGNLSKVRTSNSELGAPLTFSETNYSYDKNNQLIMVEELYDPENPAAGALYTQYCYNNSGQVVREYTGLSKPLKNLWFDEYETTGDTEFSVTKYEYDYRGNLTAAIYPDGNRETYAYTFDNLLASKSVNSKKVVEYSYDSLGRVLREYADANNYKNYTYDAVGNMLSIADNNETIKYTYNLIGSPLTESRTTTNDDTDLTKNYAYSPHGISEFTLSTLNSAKTGYEAKYYQAYTYDAFGSILNTNQKDSKTVSNNYTINYTYDPLGNIASENIVTPDNNITKSMVYNGLGQVIQSTQTSVDGKGKYAEENTYKYRLDGNLMEKTDGVIRTCYDYDGFGMLISELTKTKRGDYFVAAYDYMYDDSRNCVEKVVTEDDRDQIDNLYTYNKSNQLINKSSVLYVCDEVDGIDNYAYSYDARGNCTGYTKSIYETTAEAVSYQYNALNEFIGAKKNNVQSYAYEYDVNGRRVAKNTYVSGVKKNTTNHYWFGDNIIADRKNNAANLTSYVFGNGLCGINYEKTPLLYKTNAHGDVREIMGSTLEDEDAFSYAYNGYGSNDGSHYTGLIGTENPYRYAGYYFDSESGLYYLNSRYYNSDNASFTQRDTYNGQIGTPSTKNLYMYCAGNPVLYTDPTGHFFETLFDIAGVGASLNDFMKKPSVSNGLWLMADVAALALPFIPATGVVRTASKAYNSIDTFVDTAKVLRRADKAHDATRAISSTVDAYRNLDKTKDGVKSVVSVSKKVASYSDEAAEATKAANAAIKAKNKEALIESYSKSRKSSSFEVKDIGEVNTGRAKNNIKPDANAQGAHSVFKTDPTTGKVTNYKTYEPNSRNPSGFDEVIGYDGIGAPHTNKVTGEKLMPHMHDKMMPGGIREPEIWEIPK